jgi:hypothetical protein
MLDIRPLRIWFLLLACILVIVAGAVFLERLSPASAQPAASISGTWDLTATTSTGSVFFWTAVIDQTTANSFNLTASASGKVVTGTGTVQGATLHIDDLEKPSGLTSKLDGTISADGQSITGTWTQSDGEFGTFTASLTSTPTPTPSYHVNLAIDFLADPTSNPFADGLGNPGVWNLLQSQSLAHDGNYAPLPNPVANFEGGTGLVGFSGSNPSGCSTGSVGLPFVAINTSAQAANGCGTWQVPSHAVDLHPWATQMAIVGWKSPIDGSVVISGGVVDLDPACGNGINWSIDHTTTPVASGTIPNGGRAALPNGLSVSVAAGEFLYFLIDANGDISCDSTGFEVTIDSAATTAPSPAPTPGPGTVIDLTPPLAVTVTAPSSLQANTSGTNYSPNPFTVTAQIQNVGCVGLNCPRDAIGTTATISLPNQLALAPGETATHQLGDLTVQQTATTTWQIEALPQSANTSAAYSVIVDNQTEGPTPKTVSLSVTLPALVAQTGQGTNEFTTDKYSWSAQVCDGEAGQASGCWTTGGSYMGQFTNHYTVTVNGNQATATIDRDGMLIWIQGAIRPDLNIIMKPALGTMHIAPYSQSNPSPNAIITQKYVFSEQPNPYNGSGLCCPGQSDILDGSSTGSPDDTAIYPLATNPPAVVGVLGVIPDFAKSDAWPILNEEQPIVMEWGGGPAPANVASAAVSLLIPPKTSQVNLAQLQTLCATPARNPPGDLAPGDCDGVDVTLQGLCDHGIAAVCGVPEIDIRVNGARVSDIGLAQELVRASRMLGQPVAVQTTERAAAALATLNEVLYQEAKRNGLAVSESQARQQAQQQYEAYLQNPVPQVLPAGETAAQYFNDEMTIRAYQFGLTLNAERQAVLGNSQPSADHTPIYVQFLKGTLPSYNVSVNGLPAFSIPDALPDEGTTSTPTVHTVAGDADCNGIVNATDLIGVLRYSAGIAPVPGCILAADINCDGMIDIRDALLLLDHLAGITVNLPASCPAIGSLE